MDGRFIKKSRSILSVENHDENIKVKDAQWSHISRAPDIRYSYTDSQPMDLAREAEQFFT